ncbi:hypothetical protein G5I_12064 [Acromyrmex echinatior]|uniref:Uncharacterized protein n=1 Tax=Acromyrmex echinatior TaxID=103372 RepID=F4X1A5_ACREC|nr:hypothetical protein G5I_12064 [Acromyrmex echinatior]
MTYDFNTSLLTGDAIWPPRAKLSLTKLTEAERLPHSIHSRMARTTVKIPLTIQLSNWLRKFGVGVELQDEDMYEICTRSLKKARNHSSEPRGAARHDVYDGTHKVDVERGRPVWPIFFRNHAGVRTNGACMDSCLPPPKGIKTPLLERLIFKK